LIDWPHPMPAHATNISLRVEGDSVMDRHSCPPDHRNDMSDLPVVRSFHNLSLH
jgi:hypothetical protein